MGAAISVDPDLTAGLTAETRDALEALPEAARKELAEHAAQARDSDV